MLNSDELLSIVSHVKEIGKRTGLLFREITNAQRISARDTPPDQLNQKDQTIIDILNDTEQVIPRAFNQRLFWCVCNLGVFHWETKNVLLEYKENINALIAFKVGFAQGDDLRIVGCSLYSISDGLDKRGLPMMLPIQITNLISKKKVAEIDFLYTENQQEVKNVILQTIVKCIATKSGLSNGTEMILYNPISGTVNASTQQALLEIGFQKLPSALHEVYVLQDLRDLHIQYVMPSSLRSMKAAKYCPSDDISILGPCE
ncbi:MAG: hypothetical protein EOP45_08845 [Sphingobacteriaceae bacterium]|nr:MAG: hypothetical protein EOP45_08845 [Sphingobacteriaceae bacterium]